eukprot:4476072-Prymnesium_polylepis.2
MCEPCIPGYVQPLLGQKECVPCPPGSVQPTGGQATCAACNPGTKEPSPGQAYCAACESGHVQSDFGSIACVPCPVGSVFESGTCVPCPPLTSSAPGATSCEVCAADHYLPPGRLASKDNCKECPRGARCNWNTSVATMQVQPGFWRLSQFTSITYQCRSSGNTTACAATPDGACRPAHSGPCALDRSRTQLGCGLILRLSAHDTDRGADPCVLHSVSALSG